MPNCYDCKYVYSECEDWCWYITCEKGLETSDFDNDCKSFEQKEEIKKSMTPSLFSANYLCDPCKEVYRKINHNLVSQLEEQIYRLHKKDEDISDIYEIMQNITNNVELVYRNENGRKL